MVLLCFFVFYIVGSDTVMGGYYPDGEPTNSKPPRRMSYSEEWPSSSSTYSNSSSASHISTFRTHDNRCGRNATFKRCPMPCPRTCQMPKGIPNCYRLCIKNGCECKRGFVLSDDGRCILLKDCPDYLRCNDRNAIFKSCPNPCPRTCQSPGEKKICNKACLREGCECKKGYYLNGVGKCVLLRNCPDYLRCGGDRNAIFKSCPNPCPRTCKYPGGTGVCNRMCLTEGCECKEGYYLNNKRKCVKLQDCPGAKNCTANENFVFCNAGCPSDFCPKDDSTAIVACSPPFPCQSGCSCKPNYLRLGCEGGRCIPAADCPPVTCTRPHEVWDSCPPPCLKETCTDLDSTDECDDRFFSCRPRCICKRGFYRNDSGICVPKRKCPAVIRCGINEMVVKCRTICPPQSCENSYTDYDCGKPICEPGCDCLPDHLRNADGICIPNNECPPPPSVPICDIEQNEVLSSCKIVCPPQTCARIYTQYSCIADIPCEWGCDCLKGYLRNFSGVCIPSNDCPRSPPLICGYNEKPSECRRICPPQTCESLFAKYNCTGQDYCEPGCDCLDGYLRNKSGICISGKDCFKAPPLTCGLNEQPSDCKVTCPPQTCDSVFTTYNCTGTDNCEPGCDCLNEYLRNDSGICIPSEKCFSEPQCSVPAECRPTCAEPIPEGCDYYPPSETNQDGCSCQSGYILSDVDGTCIEIEKCPTDIGCNGDSNAVVKQCPKPCPSTCESPNELPCKAKCRPIGCECKSGYILNKHGRCILPDDCKGGNPCGQNGIFVECKSLCPTSFCPENDNRVFPVCETFPFSPCFSGCICNLNHRLLSRDNQTCVRSDLCPPVNCTRQNECWSPCPEECSSGYCKEVDQPPVTCNTLVLNCNPQCTCKKTFFRDPKTDLCVSSEKCRDINEECEE